MLDTLKDRAVNEDAWFEELRSRGYRAALEGRLEESEELCSQAVEWALRHGDSRQLDLAVCNRAAAVIELGRGSKELPRLREILVRNGDPVNCRLAAYNISRHYELVKDYKKSLFYARIALERAEALGRRDWVASTHNHIGNVLLAESFVEPAAEQYEKALTLMPEEEGSAWRAFILANLGYCRCLQQRFGESYSLLYKSLEMVHQCGSEPYKVRPLIGLTFTHIETGRYGHALRRGRSALALAEKHGKPEDVKNALYLLGEASNLNGDIETARSYFGRLQREYFPEDTYLPGFLLTVDIRKLVNLHA
jgi:tetratricopeptide (TPR) repeat protein